MTGCGEQYCVYPWDWMVLHILLRMAIFGKEGYAGGADDGSCWG